MRTRNAVLLTMVVSLAAGFLVGAISYRNQLLPYRVARAALHAFDSPNEPAEESESDALEALRALGYLGGSVSVPTETGVVSHDAARSWPGLNLYISDHEPTAFLLDMEGNEFHRWSHLPDPATLSEEARELGSVWFQRVLPLSSGELVGIVDTSVVKLDARSRVLWRSDIGAHHDLVLGTGGAIFTLAREEREFPESATVQRIREDFIVELGADGEVVRRHSLLAAVMNSPYAGLMGDVLATGGDVFHTNSLQLLRTVAPSLAAADALVSWPQLDTLAAISFDGPRVVWVESKLTDSQHNATLLDNGNILAFDNRAEAVGSRVIEIDPGGTLVWTHPETARSDYFSRCCGTAQRLPNGNTLITVTNAGAAIEVTPGGEVVWEFRSDHPNQREGGGAVANLQELSRLPVDFFDPDGGVGVGDPDRREP